MDRSTRNDWPARNSLRQKHGHTSVAKPELLRTITAPLKSYLPLKHKSGRSDGDPNRRRKLLFAEQRGGVGVEDAPYRAGYRKGGG